MCVCVCLYITSIYMHFFKDINKIKCYFNTISYCTIIKGLYFHFLSWNISGFPQNSIFFSSFWAWRNCYHGSQSINLVLVESSCVSTAGPSFQWNPRLGVRRTRVWNSAVRVNLTHLLWNTLVCLLTTCTIQKHHSKI